MVHYYITIVIIIIITIDDRPWWTLGPEVKGLYINHSILTESPRILRTLE